MIYKNKEIFGFDTDAYATPEQLEKLQEAASKKKIGLVAYDTYVFGKPIKGTNYYKALCIEMDDEAARLLLNDGWELLFLTLSLRKIWDLLPETLTVEIDGRTLFYHPEVRDYYHQVNYVINDEDDALNEQETLLFCMFSRETTLDAMVEAATFIHGNRDGHKLVLPTGYFTKDSPNFRKLT